MSGIFEKSSDPESYRLKSLRRFLAVLMSLLNLFQSSVNFIPWHFRGWIKHIPIIAAVQRQLLKRFLFHREFLHIINAGPAKGLKYPVTLPYDKGIWAGTYEPEFSAVIAKNVKLGDVCYDVGAYRGFFSGVFALAGASLVVAFEPFPENYHHLRRLAEINPTLPLRLESMAVGDKDGPADFRVMPESSMGKISESLFQPDRKGSSTVVVAMHRLDSLVLKGTLPPPQTIKIDVEGAEVSVLDGASAILRDYHPTLFIEAHTSDLKSSCTTRLQQLGYKVTVLETGLAPDLPNDPELCHLMAVHPAAARNP